MSVIYEALKKAESSKNKEKPPVSTGMNKSILLITVIGGILIGATFLLTNSRKNSNPGQLKEFTAGDSKPKNVLPQKKYSAGTYTLEGIIYENAAPLAVINGKVLKELDVIGKARVVEINPSAVKLINLRNNNTTILSFEYPVAREIR